jgi:hypothetical protein
MSLPQPETALNNACSVIFNNTLYTYTADAFQSLRLEPGAEWKRLAQGERVTGGVCVGSTTGTPETSAFFVVGGVGGSAEYKGLQKYTYATGKWESITLSSPVTDRRLGHSAIYLNSTDSILVYGGTQEGTNSASTQTFTIGASTREVLSYPSLAPPALKPILLPWSANQAVMIGGSTWNTQVMLFRHEQRWEDSRWEDSKASLAAPLPKDTSAIQAVLITGDDGSKNLITFDMTESPNAVKRTVLFSGPGVPVPNAAPARKRMSRRKDSGTGSQARRRAEPLTLNTWPAYNSTLAPKTTRTNFALAQGPDGMVVIAGGTNDEDVLCMFNARQNSWEDAGEKLGQFTLLSESSSTSASTTATSTASTSTTASTSITSSTSVAATVTSPAAATQTPTETAAATVSDSPGPPINTILGAVLGGFFGLALLLALLYLCIKRRQKRRAHLEAGHLRRASGASSSEKDGLGYDKETLGLGQGPPGVFRGHQPQGSQSSFSSMAILMGRAGQQNSAPGKSSNETKRDSSDSTFRAFKSTISKPIVRDAQTAVVVQPPEPRLQAWDEKGVSFTADTVDPKPRNITAGTDQRGSTRRSSGWNRYWSGGSALNLLGFGGGGNNAANNSQRTTLATDRSSSSHYSSPNRMTQDSATVPPLFPPATSEPRMSFSRVNAHSPTIAVYNDRLGEGMSGMIETQRPISAVSDMSASAYSSGIPESVQEAWDPTANHKPWGADRSHNDSLTGLYSTALTPASQGSRPSAQAPRQQPQAPVRDDMSWLNLGAS